MTAHEWFIGACFFLAGYALGCFFYWRLGRITSRLIDLNSEALQKWEQGSARQGRIMLETLDTLNGGIRPEKAGR